MTIDCMRLQIICSVVLLVTYCYDNNKCAFMLGDQVGFRSLKDEKFHPFKKRVDIHNISFYFNVQVEHKGVFDRKEKTKAFFRERSSSDPGLRLF